MATEKLNITGWNSGWKGGFISNVDEAVAVADGSAISTDLYNDPVVLDFDDVAVIQDIDTVTAVNAVIRCRAEYVADPATSPYNPKFEVELLINGVAQGLADIVAVPESATAFSNVVVAGPVLGDWDSDWTVAQLNSLQLQITATADANPHKEIDWFIDCIDVDVTYTALAPITRTPDPDALALTGAVPVPTPTTNFKQARPTAGAATLTGKVPPLDHGIAVDAGALTSR